MICAKCGKELSENANFCKNCGVSAKTAEKENEVSTAKKWWVWILISFPIFYTFKSDSLKNGDLFIGLFTFASFILAPLTYYKFRVKKGPIKNFLIGFFIAMFFCFMIGFLGTMLDWLFLGVRIH